MQRTTRPEGLDLPTPQLQRNYSSPSDRTPSISGSSLLSPPSVSPDPAYIAASAASQIVNSDRADRGVDLDDKTEIDTAVVSSGSLVLVNSFLDQLLFSFLASSRSTSIASLRPAILEVLKPRLGKEAIDGADEELQGYLAGGDAEELLAFHSGQEFKGEYNLNLVWRRTRLRCMVYTRLGDMEEEDEEEFLEQEQEADTNDGQARLTRDLGSVSPAAAIFLTSILEFMGEQALLVAGEASYTRMRTKRPSSDHQRAVVEEVDMEKLAFNTTLGRLWRSWKKRVRSSSLLTPRPMSRDMQRPSSNPLFPGSLGGRKSSISEENESGYFDPAQKKEQVASSKKAQDSSSAPQEQAKNLPEEPDFSDMSPDASPIGARKWNHSRSRSMGDYKEASRDSPTRTPTRSQMPIAPRMDRDDKRPTQRRKRSSSLPLKQTPFVSPIEETFTTPTEGPDPFVRDTDRAKAEMEMPKLTDDSRTLSDLADGQQAVSTMYDGAISHSNETPPETMEERNNRGISTYTESSNYTDDYDHDLAPQALSLQKPAETILTQPQDSQTSNYSFQAGEVNPVDQRERHPPISVTKDHDSDNGPVVERGNALDQSNSESDRQRSGNLAGLATLQEHQLRTYDDSGKAVKRDIPVLYESSSSETDDRNPKAALQSDAGAQDENEVATSVKTNQQAGASTQGVPPLSPLRELMDAAHDTSDEGSSMAPSYDASKSDIFVPAHRHQKSATGSVSSSMFNQIPTSVSASRSGDLRSQAIAVNTGAEKAAVQRVSPSTSTPRSATGRTSTSSNRDGRPMTAGSSTSQMSSKIKGMIGRDSGDLVRQPLPKRTSSEGSGSLVRSPTKEQDFEELIKSDETVKYTLTPQNMRNMEVFLPLIGPHCPS